MKIVKMYFFSIIVNFIPLLSIALYLLSTGHAPKPRTIFDYNISYFMYCYFELFKISLLMNLSYFLLKLKFFNNYKAVRFFAYYLPTLFFLLLSIYNTLTSDIVETSIFNYPYLLLNFLFVLLYKKNNFFDVLMKKKKMIKMYLCSIVVNFTPLLIMFLFLAGFVDFLTAFEYNDTSIPFLN